jgi:hypothetical protein
MIIIGIYNADGTYIIIYIQCIFIIVGFPSSIEKIIDNG